MTSKGIKLRLWYCFLSVLDPSAAGKMLIDTSLWPLCQIVAGQWVC